MKLYCLADFKAEFDKLRKKSSYSSIEKDILEYFFDKTVDELKSGVRLNNSDDTPYIKKRLNGSGGFRVYYLVVVKGESVYLLFVHPKTGSLGYDNITDESKAMLYKKILDCIPTNTLYALTSDNGKLAFTKMV